MLRFLKLIACDNSKIGAYAKLVDDRNESAHPNGNIFFSTQAALDIKITKILRVVDEIQTLSKPVNELPRGKPRGIERPTRKTSRGKPRGIEPDEIQRCYSKFLEDNHDPEVREYPR